MHRFYIIWAHFPFAVLFSWHNIDIIIKLIDLTVTVCQVLHISVIFQQTFRGVVITLCVVIKQCVQNTRSNWQGWDANQDLGLFPALSMDAVSDLSPIWMPPTSEVRDVHVVIQAFSNFFCSYLPSCVDRMVESYDFREKSFSAYQEEPDIWYGTTSFIFFSDYLLKNTRKVVIHYIALQHLTFS